MMMYSGFKQTSNYSHLRVYRYSISQSDVDDLCSSLKRELSSNVDGLASHLNQIVKYIASIRASKTRLNSLSPIAKLPPEILIEIFLQYKALHVRTAKDATDWQSVAHVCRYWRSLALQCSTLWTFVRLSAKDECTKELLARSNGLPLTVRDAFIPSETSEQFLAAEMSRVEDLHLAVHNNTLIADSAPLLRCLVLHSNNSFGYGETFGMIGASKLVYGDAAPLLQEFRICQHPLEWHRFRHSNLRDLRVTQPPTVLCPLKNIITALSAMPLLEILTLHKALPEDIPPSRRGSHRATLPHLRSIAISGPSFSCANLLTYLDFPSDSSIRVASHKEKKVLEGLGACLLKFTQAYPTQRLTVTKDMGTLRFAPVDEPYQPTCTDYGDLMNIRTIPEVIIFFPTAALHPVSRKLPLSAVVELAVIFSFQSDQRASDNMLLVAAAFGHVSNIRTVYLRNSQESEKDQLERLRQRDFQMGRSAETRTFRRCRELDVPVQIDPSILLVEFPRLQELKLEYAAFQGDNAKRLVDRLRKRQGCGLGIQLIAFERPIVPDEERAMIMPLLQKVVPTVIWDPRRDEDVQGQCRCGTIPSACG